MKLKITGRHMDVTPALRRHIESRFERLDRYGLKLGTVQVILSVEKLQHKAEAMCLVSGKPVQGKTATREMYETIDALVDRLDAQLRKLKDRLASHKPAKAARPRSVRALAAALPPALMVERQAVPVLALEQVEGRLIDHTEGFLLFAHAETGAIHVAHRASDGDIVVVEPYPESGRSRSASARKR